MAKETVRRFYRAATADELLAKVRDGRPWLLDEHKPCLHQRWNQGCANVRRLHAELKERGFKGDLASWILTDPGNLDDDEKEKLARARERCPHLDALAGYVTEFAKILTGLHGDRLVLLSQ